MEILKGLDKIEKGFKEFYDKYNLDKHEIKNNLDEEINSMGSKLRKEFNSEMFSNKMTHKSNLSI